MVTKHGSAFLVILAFAISSVVEAGRLRPLDIKTQYREILGDLADGQTEGALASLIEFETVAVGDPSDAWRYIEGFWKLKLHVIRDLLEGQSPELLRPIVLLHHNAYFEYLRLERRYLAGHSRTMAAEMAEIYAERVGTREAKLFSGWILTSFGAHLWAPSAVRESSNLFYRAYLVDPGNEIAVIGLAAAYEKSGEYAKAIEYLSRALLIDPGSAELRLRLALCQLRMERETSRHTVSQLTALTGEGNPAWIRSIAYQESARLQIEAGREDLAEPTLREALEILPGDQQLSLQLATILDRQRRRSEATVVLAAIAIDEWERDSPRERYDIWEPSGVEKARARHLGGTEEGLVALEAGLTAAPVEAGGR